MNRSDFERLIAELETVRHEMEQSLARIERLNWWLALGSLVLGVPLMVYGVLWSQSWAGAFVFVAGAINAVGGALHLWRTLMKSRRI